MRETDKEQINAAVKCIAETARPVAIFLFGSAARDNLRDDSDLDFCIVIDGWDKGNALRTALYERLVNILERPFDIIIVNQEILAKHPSPGSMRRTLKNEGQHLYGQSISL